MAIINRETKKVLDKNNEGKQIHKCPKCQKIHKVGGYVYAHMSFDIVTHTCDCGQETCFYKNEMWHKN